MEDSNLDPMPRPVPADSGVWLAPKDLEARMRLGWSPARWGRDDGKPRAYQAMPTFDLPEL